MARIFSGIQPTGEVHLGNYIGAVRHWVADQDTDDCLFCIVDLHAITIPQDPDVLRAKTLELAAILMGAGLDPERVTLFVQSHVGEHSKLAWVLNCFSMFGELRRMTQFKDKASKQKEGSLSVGYFDYPVLQAADILLYQTDRVPIGEDQRQHIELTRDIAQRFNSRYGETFTLPRATIPKIGARIMDLQYPENKMSKSADSPQGTILVLDSPEAIAKKVKVAVTDSGREIVASPDKPAVTNLLTIYSVASGVSIDDAQRHFEGKGYADLKRDLTESLVEFLRPVRERAAERLKDQIEIERALSVGAEKAQSIATKTLDAVYERVGFLAR
ncbi:MAG: tryptophan--tRNA ligase [Actinomycetota bacterium]